MVLDKSKKRGMGMQLLNTLSIEEAKLKVKEYFKDFTLEIEEVSLLKALDRVVAEAIASTISVPEFNRSTVDGYAVRAKDTNGASETLPSFLNNVGTVEMGMETQISIKAGECCYVPTGGMLPIGSDGVVMIEYTELLDENTVCMQKAVTPLENVLHKGDDITVGQVLFDKGHRLRSQDIGALAGIGVSKVKVFKLINVGIISTGDEIVGPDDELKMGQIRDMNTYSLGAATEKDGCYVVSRVVIKDDMLLLKQKIDEYLQTCDLLLISGGSSMGTKDVTKDAINMAGKPGVFIHGLAVKPGKPTIVGKIGKKAIFGLPGQPVSALVIYHVLVKKLIHELYQVKQQEAYILGEMSVNLSSAAGKEHYVMVNISQENDKNIIIPVHGKSGMLTMMTKSIGYIKIEQNQEGLYKGEEVKVFLF